MASLVWEAGTVSSGREEEQRGSVISDRKDDVASSLREEEGRGEEGDVFSSIGRVEEGEGQ